MKALTALVTLLLLLASPAPSSAAKPPKSNEWEGAITAISDTSVTVKNEKSARTFEVYAGTVFGQRAKARLTDFKVGDTVRVVFSEEGGKAKAENIRNPADDRKPKKKL